MICRLIVSLFAALPCLVLLAAGPAPAAEDGATLKGRVVAPAKFASQLKSEEIEVTLLEQVQADDPPIPENWSELTIEQQDKWLADFEASEAGKKYIEEQEARIAAAKKFPLKLEPDGRFVVYDVPPAVYSLTGRLEKQIDGRKFLCEVFGQLEVLAEAQEILLGDLEIAVSPIYAAGDPVPELELETIEGKKISFKGFAGKHLLVNFWSATSPPAANFQKSLQKIVSELPAGSAVELIGISVDQTRDGVDEFIKANGQVGQMVVVGGWNHPAVQEFGLHALPALWMVDPQGKFLATDSDFGAALRDSGLSLAEIINAKLQGKEIPKKEQTAGADKVGSR